MSIFKLKNGRTSGFTLGFTLFEMLVSVAIILIVTGIVFFNHTKFKSDIEISNLAYRIALSVRQAQIYSISVKQFGSNPNFTVPYGLHLTQNVNDSYIFFADSGNGYGGLADGIYSNPNGSDDECDPDIDSECVEKTTISRNNIIKGWCGIFWNGDADEQPCFSSGDAEKHWLDITFKRPNPDAIFSVHEASYDEDGEMGAICDGPSGNVQCTGWAICIVSPEGRQKQVVVYETGQISVENVVNDSGVPCDKIEL